METPSTADPTVDVPADSSALLPGIRCRRCGRVAVPRQLFGCERCGAAGSELEEVALCGHGRVLAAVVVHEHPDPGVPTPSVIGSVLLEEGPVLRGLLHGPAPDGGWPDRHVVAVRGRAEGPPVVFVAGGSVA